MQEERTLSHGHRVFFPTLGSWASGRMKMDPEHRWPLFGSHLFPQISILFLRSMWWNVATPQPPGVHVTDSPFGSQLAFLFCFFEMEFRSVAQAGVP